MFAIAGCRIIGGSATQGCELDCGLRDSWGHQQPWIARGLRIAAWPLRNHAPGLAVGGYPFTERAPPP